MESVVHPRPQANPSLPVPLSLAARVSGASAARCRPPLAAGLGLVLLAWGATAAAAALVVADQRAPAVQRPQVRTAANGATLVQLQAPSTAGVSRNVFSRFDVDSRGVILNNSTAGAQSQLGGWVAGNSQLNAGPASLILAEVNAATPSQLQGALEVAGSRAQLIVANPSGITCDGCSFINASRATLSTGVPQWEQGALTGWRVTGGTLRIGAQGMDSRKTDYTDLIARAVEVNGELRARQLALTTGLNRILINDRSTSVIPEASRGNGNAYGNSAGTPYGRTGYALDVSGLGGMYANSIRLVGTEAGMGVRSVGYIKAEAGDLSLDTAGVLENQGVLRAAGSLSLRGSSIENEGMVSANKDVSLRGRSLRVNGTVAAGLTEDGNGTREPARLELVADGRIEARGVYRSSGDLVIDGLDINMRGANVYAEQLLDLRASRSILHDLATSTAGTLRFEATDISNRLGAIDQFGDGQASLVAYGVFNGQGGYIRSEGDLNVRGQPIRMGGATTEAAGSIQWFGQTTGHGPAKSSSDGR